MINFFTLISTFSRTPKEYFTNQSANRKEMVVGFNSFNPSFKDTDKSIIKRLAPKLHKILEKLTSHLVQGMKKLHGSLNFGRSLFWIMPLHLSIKATVSKSFDFHFLDMISFMNFV